MRRLASVLLMLLLGLALPAPAPSVTVVVFASTTVFPDPGKPGTTSVDGDIGTNVNLTWAGAQSTPDCVDCSTSGTITTESSTNNNPPPQSFSLIRALMNFDTSVLGAGSIVTAATLSVKPQATHLAFNTGATVRLVPNTISSHVNYTTSDFGLIGSTNLATAEADPLSMSTGVYVDFVLNSTGLSNINVTGVSHFGMRTSIDIAGTEPVIGTDETFPNSGGAVIFWDSADVAGTSSDPKLVITYTPPPGGGPRRRIVWGMMAREAAKVGGGEERESLWEAGQ
jgi:hypothetical protein